MRCKPSVGEYLAFLSIKYEVNPEKFLHAIRSAIEHKKSRCGKLLVQCRGRIKNKFIFLIKRKSEVIAQLPIDKEFLLNRSNQLENFTESDRVRRYLAKKARTATANSIKELRTGMNHVNLKARILEVTKPKHVVTRYGNQVAIAKALIADETGTINLCLWNDQITSVSAGEAIQIENAQVSVFRGEKHMTLGRKGTLSIVEILKPQVKTENRNIRLFQKESMNSNKRKGGEIARQEIKNKKQDARINLCIFCEGSNLRSTGNNWQCLDCSKYFRKKSK